VWEKGFYLKIWQISLEEDNVECPTLIPLPSQAYITMNAKLYNFA